MKAINITPEVIKMENQLRKKGSKVAGYVLDQALNKEDIQIFRETDGTYFWFENRGAAKYAVNHLKAQISKNMKLEYRDSWKEDKVEEIKEEIVEKEDEQDLHLASPIDLSEFIGKYMKGYRLPAKFKKEKELEGEELSAFFTEVSKEYGESIQLIVNKIFGGKKPNYRTKNRMDKEERMNFKKGCEDEFQFFFDTLVWLAKPSKKYIEEHHKPTTANYMKVAADLASCVKNSLYQYRAYNMF